MRLVLLAIAVGVLAVAAPATASAPTSTSYAYFAGAGFLCDFGGCPAVAEAPDGSTVELSALGTFTTDPKSVTGGGSYTWRDANGNIVESGTWTATRLMSFVSYGLGSFGLEGGRAILAIELSSGREAKLWITCDEGDEPGGASEGIRLAVHGGPNFNREAGGLTAFVPLA